MNNNSYLTACKILDKTKLPGEIILTIFEYIDKDFWKLFSKTEIKPLRIATQFCCENILEMFNPVFFLFKLKVLNVAAKYGHIQIYY